MSCPDEFIWSMYVDEELELDERRKSELHLVACRDCRARVVALQEEGIALRQAARGVAPDAVPRAAVAATPAPRDLAWGLPVAIGAVTAVLAIGGALLDARLPGVLDLLNPRRLMGAYELVFDSVFVLRDRLPGLLELATAVGAVAAISALGCALVHALSQRVLKSSSFTIVALALLACFVPGQAARALDLRLDADTTIASGETVNESLVCTGDVVTIDGTVNGDLVVGAERVSIRGRVTGNLYVFGEEVEITGEVVGSVTAIAETARLEGRIGGALYLGGKRLTLAEGARVERDAVVFGKGLQLDGQAARDLVFGGEWMELRGEIGRKLHVIDAEEIRLLDSARIGGDVEAHLHEGEEGFARAPGAQIAGTVEVDRASVVKDHYFSRYRDPGFYVMALMATAAAFLFGLLLYAMDPRLFEADAPDARGFFRSLGAGFVIMLASPVAIFILAITVVGIPVATLTLFLLISSVYTAYVLVAGMIGRAILAPKGPGIGGFAPSLLVGVVALSLVAWLPFIGMAVRVVVILFGLGCLLERVRGLHALNLRGIRGGV